MWPLTEVSSQYPPQFFSYNFIAEARNYIPKVHKGQAKTIKHEKHRLTDRLDYKKVEPVPETVPSRYFMVKLKKN